MSDEETDGSGGWLVDWLMSLLKKRAYCVNPNWKGHLISKRLAQGFYLDRCSVPVHYLHTA